MKLSTAKKIHPETGGWFLEAYSVMTNFRAKATDSIAKVTNSFANGTNSIAKVTNSIAKTCNNQLLQPKQIKFICTYKHSVVLKSVMYKCTNLV